MSPYPHRAWMPTMASQEPVRGYVTVELGINTPGQPREKLTQVGYVRIPESYDYGAAKILILEGIITEIESGMLETVLRRLGLSKGLGEGND